MRHYTLAARALCCGLPGSLLHALATRLAQLGADLALAIKDVRTVHVRGMPHPVVCTDLLVLALSFEPLPAMAIPHNRDITML